MGAMLIIIAVLIHGVARSSATSENSVIGIATRSKRDLTSPVTSIIWSTQTTNSPGKQYNLAPYISTLSFTGDTDEAGMTVNKIPIQNPSQSVTYTPYQYHDISSSNQDSRSSPSTRSEISRQTNSASPSLQGGFQPSSVQIYEHQPSQNGFNKKSPSSHTSHTSPRYQNKVSGGENENSHYFTAPSSYKFVPESSVASQIRTSSHPTSGGYSPYPKFKSPPAVLSSSFYDDHSFDSHPKTRSSPSATLNTQSSPHGSSSQRFKAPNHKSGSYHGSKNHDATPSSYSSELASTPSFTPYDKQHGHIYHQYESAPSLGYSNNQSGVKKGSVPISLQLHTGKEISGLVKAFESEPVILNTGPDYQSHPSSGSKYDYPKPISASLSHGSSPFTSTVRNYQPGPLSGHTSRGNLPIPQYKTASSNAFNSNEYSKPANSYQLLSEQPQLHFTTKRPESNHHQSIIYHSKPFEEIRSDVEVINNKRPTTPRPYESDENDFEEGFKTVGRDFGFFGSDDSAKSRPPKVTANDGSFEIPRSNLFNSYDEAFGKYSKLAAIELDKTDKRPSVVEHSSKPVYQSTEEEDNGDDDEKSTGDYRSSYTDDKAPNSSYEEEDEEESQKSERLESDDKTEENEDDDHDFAHYKSYGEDFDKAFEDSYEKELPKSDYVHVKEVPEIEESSSNPKKRLSNRTSSNTARGDKRQKNRHAVQSHYSEPKKYETYTTHRQPETPKSHYRDNEGHGSRTSYKKVKTTESRSDDTYGHKIPRDRGTTRYSKIDVSETKETDEQQTNTQKPTNNPDTQNRYNKFSKTPSSTEKPLSSTTSSIDTVETYTFSPYNTWKPSKKSSRGHETYGAPTHDVQAIFKPDDRLPQVHQEGLRYFTNSQVVRDLTGI